MFSGVKVYRGTKDPDVDSGTFDTSTKHATIHFGLARGYAETANGNIGFRCPETWGIGMLAEYEIPEDGVFHRNFGLEDLANGKRTGTGLTIAQAEEALRAHIETLVRDADNAAREQAARDLQSFCDTFLYEIALPSTNQPLRQWVVELNDEGVQSRLLDSQDRGALAQIMIDVVRERKHAIDAHLPAEVSGELKRCDKLTIEAFQPGLANTCDAISHQIDAMLAEMRASTFSMKHDSLSSAIRWRRQIQAGMNLGRLSNSNTIVDHDDQNISAIAVLRDALSAVESAAYHEQRRGAIAEVHSVVANGALFASKKTGFEERSQALLADDTKTSKYLTSWKQAYTSALAKRDALHVEELNALSKNVLSRLAFRLTRKAQLVAEKAHWNAQVVHTEHAVAKLSERHASIRSAMDDLKTTRDRNDVALSRLEERLREMSHEGGLDFLSHPARAQVMRPRPESWEELKALSEKELQRIDAAVSAGRDHAALMQEVAECGLGLLQERVDRPEREIPQHRADELPSIEDEELVRVLTDMGEDPTAERIANLKTAMGTETSLHQLSDDSMYDKIASALRQINEAAASPTGHPADLPPKRDLPRGKNAGGNREEMEACAM